MDNFHIDVVAVGREVFDHAIAIATSNQSRATHYYIHETQGLVLCWHKPDSCADIVALPYPLKGKAIADFAWGWLQQVDYTKVRCIDFDGSRSQAFRVYTETWGNVGGRWETICGIKPEWALHGK